MAVLATIKAFIFGTLLSLNQMPDLDMKQVSCLTEAIYFEAGAESYQGKVAVANVILNRVENKAFKADTVCGIVNQPKQFSYHKTHKSGGRKKIDIYDKNQDKVLSDSLNIAIGVLSGTIKDNTNGATHFINYKIAKYKDWTAGLRRTKVIGQHTFYAFKTPTKKPQKYEQPLMALN